MSLLPASADLKARVARLQPCDCKLRNWTNPHLTIELDHISLQRGKATAISYVWGEFDRRDVPIGHPSGKSDDVIHMNLGIEWITQDVIHRLAEIAADKPIWMDQLCIPQNDEEIRKTLASIATIYKTFDVAILLPGHPCACLPRIVKELEARAAEEGKDRTPNGDDDIEGDTIDLCLNVCPLSSWTNRLWTFQELGFSQSFRCVWVSKDVAKCIFSHSTLVELHEPEDLRLAKSIAETDLQPYAAVLFQRTLSTSLEIGREEYEAVRSAWHYLHSLSLEYLSQISMEFWGIDESIKHSWIKSINALGYPTLYRFLSGEVIQRVKDPYMESNPSFKLFERIPVLRQNFVTPRKATHARDYVIAIFAEVHGYCPPPNYKNEGVPMLLKHALDWHRRESNNKVMLSTAPQGLFMAGAAESFLWRPEYYLSSDRIRTANHVYQTLILLVVQLEKAGMCDVVPFRYHSAGRIPLSAAAKSWESFHGDLVDPDSVSDFAVQLKNTMRGWERLGIYRIAVNLHEKAVRYASGQIVSKGTLQLQRLCVCFVEEKDIIKDYISSQFSMTELHLAFYALVCRSLFLDRTVCWEKGVKLMFSPPTEYRQHWRVGLCRGDVKLGGEQAYDSDHIMGVPQYLTVDMGKILFEAKRVNDHEGKPAYRVFGVWVPMEDKFENDIGAVYDRRNPEAFLL